jgi:tRNA(Ile)-lysidine synthetase-like protein
VQWSLEPGGGEAFDPGSLRFPLEVREWRPGDRIRLASGTKKLKKLFVERKVPKPERRRIPLLAERNGIVLWIAGVARAAGLEPASEGPVFRIVLRDGRND